MRNTMLGMAILLAAALAAGCTPTEANAAVAPVPPGAKVAASPKPGEIAAVKLGTARAETKEAATAMQEYVFAKKVEFVANMKNELDAIQAEMDRLAIRIDRADMQVKADATTKLDGLRAKWAETKHRLDLTEGSNESSWNDLKSGFNESHADLVDSFEKTRQWLSDKIEP
jgi:hypothetical protein